MQLTPEQQEILQKVEDAFANGDLSVLTDEDVAQFNAIGLAIRRENAELVKREQAEKLVTQRICGERGHKHNKYGGDYSHLIFIEDGNYLLCQNCQLHITSRHPEFEHLKKALEAQRKEFLTKLPQDHSAVSELEESLYEMPLQSLREAAMPNSPLLIKCSECGVSMYEHELKDGPHHAINCRLFIKQKQKEYFPNKNA